MPRQARRSTSRSVAEWFDFHYTQGLAFKALRYAYFTAVLDFNQDIVAGRFKLNDLFRWAEVVDAALIGLSNKGDEIYAINPPRSLDDLNDDAKQHVRSALEAELGKTLSKAQANLLLPAFEDAFYQHDLTWVMRQASRNLVGEFALMTCTTMEPAHGGVFVDASVFHWS